jgi:hypothetical protein
MLGNIQISWPNKQSRFAEQDLGQVCLAVQIKPESGGMHSSVLQLLWCVHSTPKLLQATMAQHDCAHWGGGLALRGGCRALAALSGSFFLSDSRD